MQGFVRLYSTNRLPMILMLAMRTKMLLVLDKALQNHREWAQYVFFLLLCAIL